MWKTEDGAIPNKNCFLFSLDKKIIYYSKNNDLQIVINACDGPSFSVCHYYIIEIYKNALKEKGLQTFENNFKDIFGGDENALSEDGEYEFSEIVEVNLSKATLFANATSWAMKFYKDEGYKNVVQLESESDGRLIIKDYGLVIDEYELKTKTNYRKEKIYYTLTIDCKDNKYRYIISDIRIRIPAQSLIGSYIEYNVKHEGHLKTIEDLNRNKENIEEQIPNVKGKKLSKLQKELDEINNKIKAETDIYNDEFNFFDGLIKSLKKKMSTNSDF